MMSRRLTAALSVLAVGPAFLAVGPALAAAPKSPPVAVVAVIDTGINPYHIAFRDNSPLAFKHPSTYIPGYPRDARALKLSLHLPYEQALARDAAVWQSVNIGRLYWVPGTRLIGVVSVTLGRRDCPLLAPVPPVNEVQGACPERTILDDAGHGTMTASRAAGAGHSLAPTARIVAIEGVGSASVRWAANNSTWIDVQTNSWLNLYPQPAEAMIGGVTKAFTAAATKMLTLAASGNGTGQIMGFAPTVTYMMSTAPPGVVLVGGHDNGQVTPWAGSPAHVVADAYGGWRASHVSSTDYGPHPISCCTSAASPYAAGGAAAIALEARRILGHRGSGIYNGVVAKGRAGLVRGGPLADGVFTLDELKMLLFHTAEVRPANGRDDGIVHWAGEPRAPDYTEYGIGANPFCQGCTTSLVKYSTLPAGTELYPHVGYGAINERSLALALQVLAGKATEPARPMADQFYQRDQEIRTAMPRG